MELIDSLEGIHSMEEKEKFLKRELLVLSLSEKDLIELKQCPSIKRHLSLQHIVEKYEESRTFIQSQKEAEKETVLGKIIKNISLLWPS